MITTLYSVTPQIDSKELPLIVQLQAFPKKITVNWIFSTGWLMKVEETGQMAYFYWWWGHIIEVGGLSGPEPATGEGGDTIKLAAEHLLGDFEEKRKR